MKRAAFLTAPGVWVRASRTAADPVREACAIEGRTRPVPLASRVYGVLLACVLGLFAALLIVHELSK